MPYPRAASSTRSISSTGESASPSHADGTPASNDTVWRDGESGMAKAASVSTQAYSGIEETVSSVSLPPIVTPQRPRLIEYAAPKAGTGSPRSSR